MKLGIIVVYLVPEDNEQLLDLHLSQIEKNTDVPYVIYAGANRLAYRFREKLANQPKVKICELPETDLRGKFEHAFYLDRLVAEAVQDGASHICTLHLDSFPIRPAWATDLAALLVGNCVLVGFLRDDRYDRAPMTACMMFTREFYLSHRPTFLPSDEILASAEYHRYSKLWRNFGDSGVGYGFKIFSEGLVWIPLTRTDGGTGGHSFGIFGDVVFHLGGVVYLKRHGSGSRVLSPTRFTIALEQRLGRLLRTLIPRALWVRLRRQLPQKFVQDFSIGRMKNWESELAADPEGFLRSLRDGSITAHAGEIHMSGSASSGNQAK
jgi:hypothetical protein